MGKLLNKRFTKVDVLDCIMEDLRGENISVRHLSVVTDNRPTYHRPRYMPPSRYEFL